MHSDTELLHPKRTKERASTGEDFGYGRSDRKKSDNSYLQPTIVIEIYSLYYNLAPGRYWRTTTAKRVAYMSVVEMVIYLL